MSARNVTCVGVCIAKICFASWVASAADNDLAEKLRKAAGLPIIKFDLGFKNEEISRTNALEAELKKYQAALNGSEADAENYIEIAAIYREQKREKDGDAARARAVEILQKRLAARPNDATALAGLSRARGGERKFDEAEQLAKRAVEAGATNAEAWYALSCCLDIRIMRLLLGDVRELSNEQTLDLILRTAPIDLVRQAEPLSAEALKCMDKAVSFAPARVDFYRWRPHVRTRRNLLKLRASGAEISQSNVTAAVWSNETIDDHKKAASLTLEDPESVFALLNFEMVRAGIVAGSVNEEFIANHRELIADTGKRLEGLAQSTNKTTALAALRRLTVVHLLHQGFDGQIEVYRRMLRLDPSGEFGWDGLIAMYAALDRHPELIKACEERVKAKDTPRNRLLLAKAYEAAGEWEKVEPQVRKSLELDPDYAAANLCLAVVLLKQSKLEEANAFLGKAHRSETTDPDHVHQLPYVQGLYWGLKGMRFMAQLELSKATNASEKAETALAIIQGR